MQPVNGRPPYPYMDDEQRKVARDAYVSWHGSRYSVPWQYAGKEVWVREHGRYVEVRYGAERIAVHAPAVRRHQVVTRSEHHEGIPLGNKQTGQDADSYSAERAGGGAAVRWRPMRVWRREVRDDAAGATANHAGGAQA